MLIVLGVIGLVLMFRGVILFNKQKVIKNKWLKCDINIENSNIGLKEVVEVAVMIEYFYPLISYSYKVSGIKYSSNKINIDERAWFSNDKKLIETKRNLLIKKTYCYVNPKDKTQSVLTCSVSTERLMQYWGLLISGMSLFILSIIFFFLF